MPLGELIKLAQEHEELYPRLLDTVKNYIKVFDRKQLDECVHSLSLRLPLPASSYNSIRLRSQLRDDLVTILDNFVGHAAHLEDFDRGWRTFMRQYLSSVQHIVGQQSLIRSSRVADTATVPTSFIEELEALRSKVDELSDERANLREELERQIAETNTLRSLPVGRDPAAEPVRPFSTCCDRCTLTLARDRCSAQPFVNSQGRRRGECRLTPLNPHADLGWRRVSPASFSVLCRRRRRSSSFKRSWRRPISDHRRTPTTPRRTG